MPALKYRIEEASLCAHWLGPLSAADKSLVTPEPSDERIEELQYLRVRRAARTLYAALVYRDKIDEHPFKCRDCKRAIGTHRCDDYWAMQRFRNTIELAAWTAYAESGLPSSLELALRDEEGPISDE